MNILFVSFGQFPNGSAHVMRLLGYAKAIKELGGNVHFLLLDKQTDSIFINKRIVLYDNFILEEVFNENNNILKDHLCMIFKLNKKIIKLKRQYNIIHFYGITGNKLFLASVLSFIAKKNGYYLFTEQTEFPFLRRYYNNRILFFIYNYLYRHFFLKNSDGHLVISYNLKKHFKKKLMFKKPIEIINMFADVSRFECKNTPRLVSPPYVGFAATLLSDNKDGVSDLIKAFAEGTINYPDWKLVIMGKNENFKINLGDQTFSELSNIIKDKVIFTGYINRDLVPIYLCNAHILALDRPDNTQSKFGFPTKLGEYLATGKPIILTRVGELPRLISHKKHCYYVPPGSPQIFGKILKQMIENYEEARSIGHKGQKLTIDVFNSVVQTKKMINFMNSVIDESQRNEKELQFLS